MDDTPTGDQVDEQEIRRRAYDLSQERPEAAAEENWLLAESQLRAAETQHDLMARIKMAVYEHP
ncbi:MAG TPA: hypothetical protein VKT18_01600 [Acidimicrobiales bacterium]|nr:hypothetical protein [Acidimicrobiales bacterium]